MEIWKDIYFVDFEGVEHDYRGKYQVSNKGRVRSLDYTKTYVNNGTLCSRTFKGKILSARATHNGYLRVRIWNRPNPPKDFFVHRLVAYMFLKVPKDTSLQINHKDENKTNNNVENLEWVSAKENCTYGTRLERIQKTKKRKQMEGVTTTESIAIERRSE